MNCHYGNTGCGVFKRGGTKLKIFLPKNQQRKLLNFEFWNNGELSKIGHHFSNKKFQKLILSKNVNIKKCAPKFVFFNKKKSKKIWMIFDIEN
jgi:hypothetical protein